MKPGTPNDSPLDKRGDDHLLEHDPVWDLLAQAPRPEPDAWFAARTLARCRHEGAAKDSISLSHFVRVWRWALGGGLALCMATVLVFSQIQAEKVDKEQKVQEAFAIMASIDNDSDSSSSPSSWQDSTSL